MYILYIALLALLGSVHAKKDRHNTGIIICIVVASFVGLIGVIYLLHRLIRCRYGKEKGNEMENERLITVYGAV